jgi:porin
VKGLNVRFFSISYILLVVFLPNIAIASRQEEAPKTSFASSPNDVSQLLSTLERENESLIPQTILTPFFKKFEHDVEEGAKRTGNNFGIEYIPLYQYANLGMPHENASGGEFEIFGHYRPLGYENISSTFGYKIEQKHAYGQVFPGEFSEQLNLIVKTISGYEKLNPAVTELWYQQIIVDDLVIVRLGKVDVTSIMNSYAFDSRKFYFLSNAFTSHPATDEPKKSLGLITGLKLSPHVYLAATVVDANGQENTSGFNTFGKGQYFSAIEFGYREIINNPSSDNYHVFIWQTAARPQLELPSEHGYSIVLQKDFSYRFIPFVKLDINEGKTQEIKRLIIAGFGFHHPFGGRFGLFGFGIGYAKLSHLAFEEKKEEETKAFGMHMHEYNLHREFEYGHDKPNGHQVIFEMFYRVQFAPYTQITPDIQVIRTLPYEKYPARWATVASIRLRTAI